MRWFNRLTIKGKLSGLILTVSLILVVIISTILAINERIRLKYNMESDLMTLAEIIGRNSGVGLAFDDAKSTEDVLKSLSAQSNIMFAHVFNLQGKLFASYRRTDIDNSTHIHDYATPAGTNDQDAIAVTTGFMFHTNIARLYLSYGL